MTIMQAGAAIVLSLVVPFAVQLIKTEAMTGKAARVLAHDGNVFGALFAQVEL